MRWKHETFKEYIDRFEQWHEWYAWYPVVVFNPDGPGHKKVWLERVERKGTYFYGWAWQYRIPVSKA